MGRPVFLVCAFYLSLKFARAGQGAIEPLELSSARPRTGLSATKELGSAYVPRASRNPTPKEEAQQQENYRKAPNKGFIVTDQGTGSLRQPTGKESKDAVKRAIAYHRENHKALQAVLTGSHVNVTTPENEEAFAIWHNASTPDPISGKERYKLRLQQDRDIQKYKEEEKKKLPIGYAPASDTNEATPSGELVDVESLTGRTFMQKLNPVTNMPPWAGCISGPTYNQFFHKDLKDGLRDLEVASNTALTWEQCADSCTEAKQDCLGYVRHDSGTVEGKGGQGGDVVHDCWTIPASEFPEGVNSTMLQNWDYGSVWFKDMSTADRVKNCSNFTAPPNVVPQSDFGTKVDPSVAFPHPDQIAEIQKKSKAFFNKEMEEMNSHPDPDMMHLTRNQSVNYRLQQASVYEKERLEKAEQANAEDIVRQQERAKKKKMLDALDERTHKERAEKKAEYDQERLEKHQKEAATKKQASAERAFKATPEGQIVAAEVQQKKESADALEEEKIVNATRDYEKYLTAVHQKERERLASLNKNISIALNATKTGNATFDQIKLLDREGIPYRELGSSKEHDQELQMRLSDDQLDTSFDTTSLATLL